MTSPTPPVCNVDALTPAQRRRSGALLEGLSAAIVETVELTDGYAFRYEPEVSLEEIGAWLALERMCCPFFRFQLEVDGAAGPVWLRLTGPAGVKEFLAPRLR